LVLSGIDLIVTPRGEYYCLEVNPNPAFSYFDLSDEKTIARHVAEILLRQQAVPR
jgi:D-alanine-D-alanine ligase-like ATP-grasp enzyme